jgi:hypothetical protein
MKEGKWHSALYAILLKIFFLPNKPNKSTFKGKGKPSRFIMPSFAVQSVWLYLAIFKISGSSSIIKPGSSTFNKKAENYLKTLFAQIIARKGKRGLLFPNW